MDAAVLRQLIGTVAHRIVGTHKTLDADLAYFGLPASTSGGSKAERTESSVAALPDDRLEDVALKILNGYQWLDSTTRNQLQDLIWAGQPHMAIPKRARREVARALTGVELVDHYQRFRAMLGTLFVLDDNPFGAFTGTDHSLGGRIDQHFYRNDDWTTEQLFEELGAIEATDRRFARLLERIVSGGVVPDEEAQRRLVAAINPPLLAAGLELRETDTVDGYPVFELVASRARTGRPKNLIFASPSKPDLRLIDAIDNDLEVVENVASVLVYDRPITSDGIRWRDLQAWWKETRKLESDQEAKKQLWLRLQQSLPENSPPQRSLFELYHKIYGRAVHDLPALLPEVWRLWDPKTVRARGRAALLQFRMDFLLLVPGGGRIVLEVDGRTHYARHFPGEIPDSVRPWLEEHVGPSEHIQIADPGRYAHTMASTRDLVLAGYEVYRFGADELRSADQARPMLIKFFADLFRQHRVALAEPAR